MAEIKKKKKSDSTGSDVPSQSNVIYPFLVKCSTHMPDEFWKSIVMNLALGKYPKCIYFSNYTIFSTVKKVQVSYSIPLNRPEKEVAHEIYLFLLENTSLSSMDDNIKKKEMIALRKKNFVMSEKWSMIKKKNVKELIMINYVLREKRERKLSWDKAFELLSLIKLGFVYRLQASKDVEYSNGEIQSIKGIVFNPQLGCFENHKLKKRVDPKSGRTRDEEEGVDEEKSDEDGRKFLSDQWERYIALRLRLIR
jgi:hypothetical protein